MLMLASGVAAVAAACPPASAAAPRAGLSSPVVVEWSTLEAALTFKTDSGSQSGDSGSHLKDGQPKTSDSTPSTSPSTSGSSSSSPSGNSSPSDPTSPDPSSASQPDGIPALGKDLLTAPGAPAPTLGQQVAVAPASGTVLVQVRGKGPFTALHGAADLPVGSVIDATKGTIVLASAIDSSGTRQFAAFHGASFRVAQPPNAQGMTDIALVGGSSSACGGSRPRGHRASVAAHRRTKVIRSLWATDDHGRFQSRGRSSVATVRGTTWVTTDRCDGTLTSVSSGQVSVRDLRAKRTVVVSAGHSYLARG